MKCKNDEAIFWLNCIIQGFSTLIHLVDHFLGIWSSHIGPPIKDLPDKMTNMRGSYWILYSVIEYSQFIARRKSCTIWKELHCYGKWDESWVTISCWMSSFYHRMPRGSFVGASSVGNSYSSPSNHKSPGFFERSPLTVGIRKISGKRFFSLPSYHHGRENLASKLRRCQVEGGSV